jgi:hypothetical protein
VVAKLIALVLPLGLDTFAVAAALGAVGVSAARRLRISFLFTGFEAGMPLIGLALGAPLGRAIGGSADYVAIGVLLAFGLYTWEREAWTFMPQSNLPEKVFVVERIRLVSVQGERAYEGGARPGDREYRFGYYTIGRIGRRAGQWTWGQFSPMIPEGDLMPLVEKAQAEGTIR